MNRSDPFKIPFPELLNELRYYNPVSLKEKAQRVALKCERLGKHELAAKIREKYGRPQKHDSVIAFEMTLTKRIKF
jgi:hypothetical protein